MILEFHACYCHLARGIAQVGLLYFFILFLFLLLYSETLKNKHILNFDHLKLLGYGQDGMHASWLKIRQSHNIIFDWYFSIFIHILS